MSKSARNSKFRRLFEPFLNFSIIFDRNLQRVTDSRCRNARTFLISQQSRQVFSIALTLISPRESANYTQTGDSVCATFERIIAHGIDSRVASRASDAYKFCRRRERAFAEVYISVRLCKYICMHIYREIIKVVRSATHIVDLRRREFSSQRSLGAKGGRVVFQRASPVINEDRRAILISPERNVSLFNMTQMISAGDVTRGESINRDAKKTRTGTAQRRDARARARE